MGRRRGAVELWTRGAGVGAIRGHAWGRKVCPPGARVPARLQFFRLLIISMYYCFLTARVSAFSGRMGEEEEDMTFDYQ